MVFFDTSAIIALFDRRSPKHALAQMVLNNVKEKRERLLMTDYVLDESITTALTRIDHKTAFKVGDFLLSSNIVDLMWLDETLIRKAWDYFKKYDDKAFSFTDCTSFVLMKDVGIRHYFSFDDDFKQAGFESI